MKVFHRCTCMRGQMGGGNDLTTNGSLVEALQFHGTNQGSIPGPC